MSLPIARISISKFMAIEELSFTPGAITLFRGKNGRGKTSVAKAIIAAFQGAPGEFVREGETEAKLIVVLRDRATTIDRRISADGKQKPPRIKPANEPVIKSPAAWLAEQVDDLINPLDFLTTKPEKRVEWLLEALPVKVTARELARACGSTMSPADLAEAAELHALLAIDRTYTRLYDARREANVEARAKRASIAQLQESLPPLDEEATDWAVVEQELAAEVGAIDGRLRAESLNFRRDLETAKASLLRVANTEKRRIADELAADILALQNRAREATAEAEKIRLGAVRDAEIMEASAQSTLAEGIAVERQGVAESLATARARREESDRSANTRRIMDGFGIEAVGLETRWKAYDDALANLLALKAGLLERMPIPGIETREGRLYRGNIPFEMLNTAQCMDIAMEVAELRAGKIGLVCVDGIERLDPVNRALWYERARNSGLHFFFTEVSADEVLTVTDEDGNPVQTQMDLRPGPVAA